MFGGTYLYMTQYYWDVQCAHSQTEGHTVHDTQWDIIYMTHSELRCTVYNVHTLKQWYMLYMTHIELRGTVYILSNSGTYCAWHTVNQGVQCTHSQTVVHTLHDTQ